MEEDYDIKVPEKESDDTQTIKAIEDVEVTANEPSDTIKDENIDKCDKCLKSTFRYRHDGFCGKCVSNNIIDVNEQQEINDAMRCKKCMKPKFRSRHLLFCSDNCYEEMKTTTTSTSTVPPSTTSQTTTTAAPKKSEMSNQDSNTNKKIKVDKYKNKGKDEPSKNKNKEKKQKRREQKRKEKQERKLLKQKKKYGQTTDSDVEPLGPLGNVLKYLIVANTWN